VLLADIPQMCNFLADVVDLRDVSGVKLLYALVCVVVMLLKPTQCTSLWPLQEGASSDPLKTLLIMLTTTNTWHQVVQQLVP
jgi:hypothetical protein